MWMKNNDFVHYSRQIYVLAACDIWAADKTRMSY